MHQLRHVFLWELKEANTVLCAWMPLAANLINMYTKSLTQQLFDHHCCTIVCDDNDNDDENKKYLQAILDTSHIVTTNSGEGVGTGSPVGVGISDLPVTPES